MYFLKKLIKNVYNFFQRVSVYYKSMRKIFLNQINFLFRNKFKKQEKKSFSKKMQSSRKIIIGGNWKSFNTVKESQNLVNSVINNLKFDPARIGKPYFDQSIIFLKK